MRKFKYTAPQLYCSQRKDELLCADGSGAQSNQPCSNGPDHHGEATPAEDCSDGYAPTNGYFWSILLVMPCNNGYAAATDYCGSGTGVGTSCGIGNNPV